MKHKQLNISILLFLACVLSGCIHEELSACRQGVLLRFKYTLNPTGENLFGATVDRISVFVFDINGLYVKTLTDSGGIVSNDYSLILPPEYDECSVVAVGTTEISSLQIGAYTSNDESLNFTPFLKVGETTLHDFRLKVDDNEVFPLNPGAMLIGSLQKIMTTGYNAEYTIEMTNNVNVVNLKISGLSHLKYTPVLVADNGRYDYENNIPVDSREMIYLSANAKQADHNFSFNTLRLVDGSEIKLLLLDEKGENAVTGFSGLNLISLIKESPDFNNQLDLDKENLYNLELRFDGATLVSISVNNWEKVMVKPEV